ncbi:MAG: LysM peptidoglycan-binding domain-containing protein [Kurthia sp.]|nr:LysM peptidoglycan-binding domain-containing protein [Candidatus Kurthia equi]
MKSLKALVLGTTVAVGVAGFAGTNASAHSAYTVQKGDTLAKISQKFAGDFSLVQSIASTNNIANLNLIYAGTTLTIPDKGSAQVQQPVQQPVQQQVQQQVQQKQQVQQPVQKVAYQAPQQKQVAPKATQKTTTNSTSYTSTTTGSSSAKSWIAMKESTNNYSARSASGKYIGKYQLDRSYLNGDYSAANQERVAENYVKQRYGSWEKAKAFHQANGWY